MDREIFERSVRNHETINDEFCCALRLLAESAGFATDDNTDGGNAAGLGILIASLHIVDACDRLELRISPIGSNAELRETILEGLEKVTNVS